MKKLMIAASLVALAGCSANPFKSDTTQIKASSGANSVPTWYLETPKDNGVIIYASATGISDDMQFSMDKAMHEAKVTLGDKVGTLVSSETKKYIGDNAAGALSRTTQKTERVSKSGFKNVNVSNYIVQNKAIFTEGSNYRTYVLLSLNIEGAPEPEPEVTNDFTEADNSRADAALDKL